MSEKINLEDLDLTELNKESLPFGLIFMDELKRMREEAAEISAEPEAFTQVVEKKDFTEDSGFLVEDQGLEMPVEGMGKIKQFIVLARDKSYEISIRADRESVVNGSFSDLQELSVELSDVAAYEKDGKYLVAVSGYPFRKRLRVAVKPQKEVYFDAVRLDLLRKKRPRINI